MKSAYPAMKSRNRVRVGDYVFIPANDVDEVPSLEGVVRDVYSMAKPSGPEKFWIVEDDDGEICEVPVDGVPNVLKVVTA